MRDHIKGKRLSGLIRRLAAEPRMNAVLLCSLQAMPEQYLLKLQRRGDNLIMAGSRPDLPFKTLTFSFGEADDYLALIRMFDSVFSPGDEVYSLLPEGYVKALEQVVDIKTRHLESQLFRTADLPPPDARTAHALESRGHAFRMLGRDDLPAAQRLMQELGSFVAFSGGSFARGVFFGAYFESKLVAVAGTHAMGADYGEIGNVATMKQYRGRGLARACMELLLNELCRRNLSLFLFAWRRDFLIRFYESLGFSDPLPFELVSWEYPD